MLYKSIVKTPLKEKAYKADWERYNREVESYRQRMLEYNRAKDEYNAELLARKISEQMTESPIPKYTSTVTKIE